MIWHNVAEKDFPPENKDVLGYTDTNKYRVVCYHKGIWNTYLNIVAWAELPNEQPSFEEVVVKKKRGRPKKEV